MELDDTALVVYAAKLQKEEKNHVFFSLYFEFIVTSNEYEIGSILHTNSKGLKNHFTV